MTLTRQLGLASLLVSVAMLAACGSDAEPAADDKPSTVTASNAYPLDTCVISGQKLGDHGEVVEKTHDGVTVKLCCAGCEDKFNEDPAKFVALVTEAKAKADEHAGHDHDHDHDHDH